LWFVMSIPNGLFLSLNLELNVPKIFPRPQPISKILDLEFSLIFFIKNLLNDSI